MDADLLRLPPVLMYHSVERYEQDPHRVTVHPRRFERQLGRLRALGLRGVSMRELLHAHRHGTADGLIGLTFDDGYVDFVTEVVPALVRYGWTATVFVIVGELGGRNHWDDPGPSKPLMGAADVWRAADAGMEIGSHSLHHIRLTETDAAALHDQVETSRHLLAELIDAEVTGFCYPYGAAGEREQHAVRAAGYGYACATGFPDLAGRFALPRIFVGDRDDGLRLRAKFARHRLQVRRALRHRPTLSTAATP